MSNDCDHPDGAIVDWREYQDQEFLVFRCGECDHVVLARANGLEPKYVVNSEPASHITAYLMPDPTIPEVR